MNRQEALAILQLPATADSHAIRAALFQHYQQLFADHQGPVWVEHLRQLTQARDALLVRKGALAGPLAQSARLLQTKDLPRAVYVLLDRHDQSETIYTLRIEDQDLVLAFENEFTARTYARALIQKELSTPWCESFNPAEIIEFCEAAGYGLLLVPAQQMASPPLGSVDGAGQ